MAWQRTIWILGLTSKSTGIGVWTGLLCGCLGYMEADQARWRLTWKQETDLWVKCDLCSNQDMLQLTRDMEANLRTAWMLAKILPQLTRVRRLTRATERLAAAASLVIEVLGLTPSYLKSNWKTILVAATTMYSQRFNTESGTSE